jgi:O-antigen ligase
VLLLSTGAGFALGFTGTESQPLVLLFWLVAYAVGGGLLIDTIVRLRRRPPVPPWLLLFVILAATSTFWSESPSVTMRRAFALAGTTVVGLAIADRLRPIEALETVRRVVLLIALASLLLYVIRDPRALDDVHATLRGVVVSKNTLGRIVAVGLIATACLAYLDRRRWRVHLASAVPMAIALGLTDSAGGLLLSIIGLSAIASLAIWRSRRDRLALCTVVAAGLGFGILAFPNGISAEDVTQVSGRDTTLTGRTEIWDESVLAARDRLVSGYGFGAFWGLGGGGVEADAAARIRTRLAVPVANAHSGFLDVTLDLGISGAVVAALVLLAIMKRAAHDGRLAQVDGGLFRAAIAGILLVSTATESGLLQENAFLTVLLVVAAAIRADPAKRQERRSLPAALAGDGSSGPRPALTRSG